MREKIVSLMRSIPDAPKKQLSEAELYKLKAAASRLAQMLQAAVDAERQALLSAAERLDRWLSDISTGKNLSPELKRQQIMTAAVKPPHTTQPPEPC